jgi:8-oxo-dGTP diphosphatase
MDTPATTRTGAVVSTVIFTLKQGQLQVCLDDERQSIGLPETPVSPGMSLESCARQQIFRLCGRTEVYLQQLYTFDGGSADASPLTITYFALAAADKLDTHANGGGHWANVLDTPPVPPRHSEIISYALQRLRYKIEYSAVAFELLPETFTLRELQDAYMIILNDFRLDKANFRKKLRDARILEETNTFRETRGRPARLYRFREDAQLETKARRFFP